MRDGHGCQLQPLGLRRARRTASVLPLVRLRRPAAEQAGLQLSEPGAGLGPGRAAHLSGDRGAAGLRPVRHPQARQRGLRSRQGHLRLAPPVRSRPRARGGADGHGLRGVHRGARGRGGLQPQRQPTRVHAGLQRHGPECWPLSCRHGRATKGRRQTGRPQALPHCGHRDVPAGAPRPHRRRNPPARLALVGELPGRRRRGRLGAGAL
mmetsp:Transcript_135160/g.420057  ORF Transcript_135160/g.420057 Transcript_135160/m.420057 type:complete len:208 (+) Transcript_135160:49-672(+)